MADSPTSLCHFTNQAVQGISAGASEQEVVVTLQQNGVICYDTQTKVWFFMILNFVYTIVMSLMFKFG